MLGKKFKNPREHRKMRLRHTLKGTTARPRMSVFRSSKHIYVQIIDDDTGTTLAAASTIEPAMRAFEGNKIEQATQVGKLAAERAVANGITKLVFDRNGFRYTGRVAAASTAAHAMGLLGKIGYSADGAQSDETGTDDDESETADTAELAIQE